MRKINWFSALFLFLLIEASFINSFIIITKPFYGWETGLLKSLCLKSGALQKCEKGEKLENGKLKYWPLKWMFQIQNWTSLNLTHLFIFKLNSILISLFYQSTVKLELANTSEWLPPVHNDHHFKVPCWIFTSYMTSEQQPPVNNGHYFGVSMVIVVNRFDCIPVIKFVC